MQLYEQHGGNSFLKTKFKAGANDYNMAKLREELERLVASPLTPSKGEGVVTAPVSAGYKPQPTADQAKRYLQICNQRDKLYRTLNMLMEQKHHLPEGEELRKCCAGILITHQKVTEAWAAIDYYQQQGRFADDEAVAEKPPIEAKKEMQLLRQTISKAKKRLLSATCRDREQTQKLLSDSQARLEVLVKERKAAK